MPARKTQFSRYGGGVYDLDTSANEDDAKKTEKANLVMGARICQLYWLIAVAP